MALATASGEPSLVEVVGARVRAERVQRGMSRRELASLADIGHRTLVTIELAQSATSLTTLDAIARALDVPVASLVSLS